MMMMNNNLALKKTNSFPLQNYYPSPPKHNHNNYDQKPTNNNMAAAAAAAQILSRKSPHSNKVEFPTSPRPPPQKGDEIFHFAHPQHPIAPTNLPDLFTCAACKEYGAGERYACGECDYQLHDFCALAPSTLHRHPIHPVHKIVLFAKPVKGGMMKSKCDICAKPTKGSVFKCTACSFQMHPCCAMLSTEINISVHPHTLRLLPTPQYSANGDPGFICAECNRRRSGRVYHCTVCDYHLHAVCAKNMVNGLQANGLQGMDKPSKFGAAAKVASKVVIEFIGGLIEGLGEGVGQVLIQTAARGRCQPRSSTRTP